MLVDEYVLPYVPYGFVMASPWKQFDGISPRYWPLFAYSLPEPSTWSTISQPDGTVIGVRVAVRVAVGGIGVGVRVTVRVSVAVAIRVRGRVGVRVGVRVAVRVRVAIGVGVRVALAVGYVHAENVQALAAKKVANIETTDAEIRPPVLY